MVGCRITGTDKAVRWFHSLSCKAEIPSVLDANTFIYIHVLMSGTCSAQLPHVFGASRTSHSHIRVRTYHPVPHYTSVNSSLSWTLAPKGELTPIPSACRKTTDIQYCPRNRMQFHAGDEPLGQTKGALELLPGQHQDDGTTISSIPNDNVPPEPLCDLMSAVCTSGIQHDCGTATPTHEQG